MFEKVFFVRSQKPSFSQKTFEKTRTDRAIFYLLLYRYYMQTNPLSSQKNISYSSPAVKTDIFDHDVRSILPIP